MKSWIYFTRMWLTISLQSRDYLSPVMWLYPHFPVHNSPLNHTSYPHILQLQPTSSCDRISSVTWLFLFSHVTILPYETITHVTTSISHMITAPPFQAMFCIYSSSMTVPTHPPAQSGCGGSGRLERSRWGPGHTLQGLACCCCPTVPSHPALARGCCGAGPGRREKKRLFILTHADTHTHIHITHNTQTHTHIHITHKHTHTYT